MQLKLEKGLYDPGSIENKPLCIPHFKGLINGILNENGKIFALGKVSSILIKLVPFHSSGHGKFFDHTIPNFNSNFNKQYSDLSNEVYNASVFYGTQEIHICQKLPKFGVPIGYLFM